MLLIKLILHLLLLVLLLCNQLLLDHSGFILLMIIADQIIIHSRRWIRLIVEERTAPRFKITVSLFGHHASSRISRTCRLNCIRERVWQLTSPLLKSMLCVVHLLVELLLLDSPCWESWLQLWHRTSSEWMLIISYDRHFFGHNHLRSFRVRMSSNLLLLLQSWWLLWFLLLCLNLFLFRVVIIHILFKL